jgi:hypothetical protein
MIGFNARGLCAAAHWRGKSFLSLPAPLRSPFTCPSSALDAPRPATAPPPLLLPPSRLPDSEAASPMAAAAAAWAGGEQ